MTKRAILPMNMGQAILDAKRQSHMYKYGNSAVAVQGGIVLVPKMDGSLQIRRAGRGGDRMTNAMAKGIHGCAGKTGDAFKKCLDSITGFRAPAAMSG